MTSSDIIIDLFEVIEERRETLPPDSYTASLFAHERGQNAVLEKLGEESSELLLAAKDDDDDAIVHESADLIYHLLVLLAMHDIPVDELLAELADRRGGS